MRPLDSPLRGHDRARALARGLIGFLRWSWKGFLAAFLGFALFLVFADRRVEEVALPRIHRDLAGLPTSSAALVLGTSKFTSPGRLNLYYEKRILAAAELFKAGKVRAIVVSGDNRTSKYNEPQRMREDLMALGVPGEYITCDYAGFRTLDSVVRMEAVFSVKDYVIVSQGFHVARAIYLGRAFGQTPLGFVADGGDEDREFRVRAREVLARAMAVIDVNLLGRKPKFLGEPVKVVFAPPNETVDDGK